METISTIVGQRSLLAAAIVAMVGLGTAPASAHHSFAMFNRAKTISVEGALVNLEFANPHVWMKVMAPGKAGATAVWAIEMGAVNQVRNMGLTPEVLKPGDKLTVNIHPLRNGAIGGSFISARLPDGREFVQRGIATPAAPQPRP